MKLKDVTSDNWEFIIDYPQKQKQGVHVYYKGCPYPRRVYYDLINDPNHLKRALIALGTVKKFLYSLTYLSNIVIPYRFSFKSYDTFLLRLVETCWWNLHEFYLKDDEWSEPVWEIGKLVKAFLKELGFSKEVFNGFSLVIMCFLEYDNAYRYRIQDLLGSVTQLDRESLKHIIELYKKRESLDGASSRMNKLMKLLSLALYIPKIKNSLSKAQTNVNFDKIRFDENDRFHFSFWKGYDFEGKTFEERFSPYEELYKTIPFKKENREQQTNFMLGL